GRPAMINQRQAADEFAAIERLLQIDAREHFRQKTREGVNIAQAVIEDLCAFFDGERPALDDALLHRLFVLTANSIEAVIGERAEQTFARRRQPSVGDVAKLRTEIENALGERPA